MKLMFTGLVEDIGRLVQRERAASDEKLTFETQEIPTSELALGDSVAVNGCCLTVTATKGKTFSADASYETLAKTGLGQLRIGDPVHLERALRVGDRLGGHIVQGHVDDTGMITRSEKAGKATNLWVRLPTQLLNEVVHKGGIAIDGVSLTLNDVSGNIVQVTIVPHTQDKTLLTTYKAGRVVNIETDVVGKYVKRLMQLDGAPSGVGDLLAAYGYTNTKE